MRRACLVRFRLNCQCCEAGNIFGERFGVVVVVVVVVVTLYAID